MSYTMTVDIPTKAAAWVERRGPRFQSQLRSLFIAFVTTEMNRDGVEWRDEQTDAHSRTGAAFARAWGCMGVGEDELDLSRRHERLREINLA